jgi:hypothetical protein
MDPDQHPCLIGTHGELPRLMLVLPGDLDNDQAVTSLVQAISKVRADLAELTSRYQELAEKHAAAGDRLRQAQCRGQALATEHAVEAIDESIIGVFDLWEQYDDQAARQGRPQETAVGPNSHA